MHIVIAPNAFKHSLTATQAANALREGFELSKLDCTTDCFPVADGGDGTGSLILQHREGIPVETTVLDPLGRKINASFGLIEDGKTAVIEMADASGIRLLSPGELNPMLANSFGTGQLILEALTHNVKKIILCIGGSATVDGATGMLKALGARFLDKHGKELASLPSELSSLHEIDVSSLDTRLSNIELVLLCDVDNTLLGDEGAAAVFGPQKGATPTQVKELDNLLSVLSSVIQKTNGKNIAGLKHGGAAGGTAAGLSGLVNAKLVNGIDYFLSLTGFDYRISNADLVITGEGSIDMQTLQGKGPFGVAKKAKQKGVQVIGVAGKIPTEIDPALTEYFDQLLSINEEPFNLKDALRLTHENLVKTAIKIGNSLA